MKLTSHTLLTLLSILVAACCGCLTCSRGNPADITWIMLPGGTYQMGSTAGTSDEQPAHAVTLSGFEMAKSETTVAQYAACATAGACRAANTGLRCTWGVAGAEQYPINYVDWYQSQEFCTWAGGRLCTEAEWEYAARSGGKDQTYAWGDEDAMCDYAVIYGNYNPGCKQYDAWAVCSKTAGNSTQGVCDLAGNVLEWVADWYGTYPSGAQTNPTGPSGGSGRVYRGGGWNSNPARDLRALSRNNDDPASTGNLLGMRCCRSSN